MAKSRNLVVILTALFIVLLSTLITQLLSIRVKAQSVGNAISGRVTDNLGNPVQGVTVTATFVKGTIRVEDENGAAIPGAQVFRENYFAGTTDANGFLIIPNLEIGENSDCPSANH